MDHHRALDHRHAIESCTLQLHTWKPFLHVSPAKTLVEPTDIAAAAAKRPCLSDRTTAFSIDLSRLSLIDDDRRSVSSPYKRGGLRWKRRRRGSRSVSGRSSDRSGTRRTYGTCSDLPMAAGTDSSGETFFNGAGDGNWGSDVSEASKNNRREREAGERDGLSLSLSSSGFGQIGNMESNLGGNESGYGSEPGYRGDAEFGYGDEVDTEEDDHRLSLWGDKFQGTDSKMEIASENTLQKAHHRGRRKKHDVRIVVSRPGIHNPGT